jgi:hypothetical protein
MASVWPDDDVAMLPLRSWRVLNEPAPRQPNPKQGREHRAAEQVRTNKQRPGRDPVPVLILDVGLATEQVKCEDNMAQIRQAEPYTYRQNEKTNSQREVTLRAMRREQSRNKRSAQAKK